MPPSMHISLSISPTRLSFCGIHYTHTPLRSCTPLIIGFSQCVSLYSMISRLCEELALKLEICLLSTNFMLATSIQLATREVFLHVACMLCKPASLLKQKCNQHAVITHLLLIIAILGQVFYMHVT